MIIIYQKPTKIGQYIGSNTTKWILEYYDDNTNIFVNPVTGNTGGDVKLKYLFDTEQMAIEYAIKNNLEYKVIHKNHKKHFFNNSYKNNFA